MRTILTPIPVTTILFLLANMLCQETWAQVGAPKPSPTLCIAGVCFQNQADEAKFESENNCKFGELCASEIIKPDVQCCGIDARTGKPAPQQKVATELNAAFDWDAYQRSCPNMKQSEAPPNGAWRQCVVGQRHAVDDDYAVVIVEKNGNARDYCIDGCSTPPGAVTTLWRKGSFIFRDKDNPTGNGPGGYGAEASYFGACVEHDKCYQTCDTRNQQNCDDRLLANMLTVCRRIPAGHNTTFINNIGFEDVENTRDKCIAGANDMLIGLRSPLPASKKAFKTRRQQYCQCC